MYEYAYSETPGDAFAAETGTCPVGEAISLPPPSFAPASRVTTGAVPKALREREDDVLPYRGIFLLTIRFII